MSRPCARCCSTICPPLTPRNTAFPSRPRRSRTSSTPSIRSPYLIAEAGDEEQLSQFLGPFVQAGSVELLPASSYEMVINRGGLLQRPPDAAAGQPRIHAVELSRFEQIKADSGIRHPRCAPQRFADLMGS